MRVVNRCLGQNVRRHGYVRRHGFLQRPFARPVNTPQWRVEVILAFAFAKGLYDQARGLFVGSFPHVEVAGGVIQADGKSAMRYPASSQP